MLPEAVITIITNNGQLDLRDYDFALLYSRRENDRMVARIVAKKDNVIRAKIEPIADGEDQKEAFGALKKYVEMELDGVLESVPSGSAAARASTEESFATTPRATAKGRFIAAPKAIVGAPEFVAGPDRASNLGVRNIPTCSPPAYGSRDANIESRKGLLGNRDWDKD